MEGPVMMTSRLQWLTRSIIYYKSFHMRFSYSCAAIEFSTDGASRGPSAIAEPRTELLVLYSAIVLCVVALSWHAIKRGSCYIRTKTVACSAAAS